MVFGDRALARIGGRDRGGNELSQRRKLLAGLRVMHALPGQDQRVLRREQHLHGLLDRIRIGRHPGHRHRRVVERALEFRLEHLVGHLDHHRAAFARAHGVIGAPHQIGQFLHIVRQRGPFGDRAVDVGGAEHRPHVLPRQRQTAGDDQHRDVLGIGLRHAGKRILDAGAVLRGEHAVPPAAPDARIAVGDADPDPLLPA